MHDTASHRSPDNRFQVLFPDDFELRVKRMAKYAVYHSIEEADWQREERREVLQACQDFTEVIKEARAMGDPSDPKVQAFWERHNRKGPPLESYLSKKFPDLPEIPLAPITGRYASPDYVIHKSPKRKPRVTNVPVAPKKLITEV